MTAQQDPSRGQRLLFTFLGCTLVGPFLAGFSVFAMLILARPLQLDGLIPVGVANPGHSALATFVWSAVPSALAAIGLAWPVWNHATFSWLSAAAAGAVGFMLASIATDSPPNPAPAANSRASS